MHASKTQAPPNPLRYIYRIFICVVVIFGLTACAGNTDGITHPVDPSAPQIKITTADADIRENGATHIDLNGIDQVCFITEPGTYILSGTLAGSIQVNAEEQIVHLIMDNVTVDAPSGPALEVLSAGKIILTIKEGTTNTFQDSGYYENKPDADACIYSACDLTINGDGVLNVSGYYKDAIHTKDVLKILNSSCFIQAKRDGLHGNDGIVVRCKTLTVQSERNGLHSTKTGKPTKGNIEIYESNCSIIGGKYAISCVADLHIADSSIYTMGVYGNIQVSGVSYIEEGSLENA